MKNEPCVRFGIFINPKISENPADSRKRRPPSVMLLTASTSHRLMGAYDWEPASARGCRKTSVSPRGGRRSAPASALHRRKVARIDGLGEKPLLVIGPELAHVRIGLDRRVGELVPLPLAAADVEVADDVAEVVEAERSARRVGERDGAQRLDQRLLVVGLPTR